MCIATTSIESKVREYLETKALVDELTAEMDDLADQIKSYMDAENADTMQAGANIVTYKEVVTKRIDTTALKKLLGDALDPYFKTIVSRRFQVK